jgi:hypothetical protein
MEQGVRARRQRQTPGMAKLEVKQQRPAKADAIEHFREDIHVGDVSPADDQTQCLDDRSLPSDIPPH